MTDQRTVRNISITPRLDQVVDFGGQIVRELRGYEVSWTECRPGYIDIDHQQVCVTGAMTQQLVTSLTARLRDLQPLPSSEVQ
jgi:hypothetical protein